MRRLYPISTIVCLSILVCVSQLSAQVCTLSVAGLNRYRFVAGSVMTECGNDLHTAPFGNWGVTSTVGKKHDSHQFDGWCHDSWVCDNYGSCRTKCTDGWYEWNSCTDSPRFAAPNCTLYNSDSCDYQYSTQDINIHGTEYLNLSTTCPFDSDGDGICDTGGCSALTSYSQPSHFMSMYELDPWSRDTLVQTLYFPEMTVPLDCNAWGCNIAGSAWVSPSYYDSPSWPPKVYAEAAIVVGWGRFSDSTGLCKWYGNYDRRYACH